MRRYRGCQQKRIFTTDILGRWQKTYRNINPPSIARLCPVM
jgi:hypothetical protein